MIELEAQKFGLPLAKRFREAENKIETYAKFPEHIDKLPDV